MRIHCPSAVAIYAFDGAAVAISAARGLLDPAKCAEFGQHTFHHAQNGFSESDIHGSSTPRRPWESRFHNAAMMPNAAYSPAIESPMPYAYFGQAGSAGGPGGVNWSGYRKPPHRFANYAKTPRGSCTGHPDRSP